MRLLDKGEELGKNLPHTILQPAVARQILLDILSIANTLD